MCPHTILRAPHDQMPNLVLFCIFHVATTQTDGVRKIKVKSRGWRGVVPVVVLSRRLSSFMSGTGWPSFTSCFVVDAAMASVMLVRMLPSLLSSVSRKADQRTML